MERIDYEREAFEQFRPAAADAFEELRRAAKLGGAQIMRHGRVEFVRFIDRGEYVVAAINGAGLGERTMAAIYSDAQDLGATAIMFQTRRLALVKKVAKHYAVSMEGCKAGYHVCRIKVEQ